MIKIRVDFNSVDEKGRVRSSLKRAEGTILPGDEVLAYDSEGHRCNAYVVDIQNGRVSLELDTYTWVEDRVEVSSESPFSAGFGTAAEWSALLRRSSVSGDQRDRRVNRPLTTA